MFRRYSGGGFQTRFASLNGFSVLRFKPRPHPREREWGRGGAKNSNRKSRYVFPDTGVLQGVWVKKR